ncbi:hypothetical protein ACIREE_25775 [Streptomyces sp. NPDC102467]|uniref:hypothetical protein n=1 Tax=Streptomyces sp. NPDC102467 TaxID=3366179 RepID=UPI00381854CC
MHIRRQLLFMAITPVAIGVAASSACADPRPAAPTTAARHQPAPSTRTATVVTELSAQEVSAGSNATLQVKGRLVEGDTLLYPLPNLAVSVKISGADRTAPQRCNTATTREGRFSCTFHVTAHTTTTATVIFGGNALFSPGSASTSIGSAAQRPPSPATTPSPTATPPASLPATPTAVPAPLSNSPAAVLTATALGATTRPAPLPSASTRPTASRS